MEANELKDHLLHEIFKAIGLEFSLSITKVLQPMFEPAAGRFAELAVKFDRDVRTYGFNEASRRWLPLFTGHIRVTGTNWVPLQGPLLILSNHPGTYDSLIIASSLPRSDLKIIASGVPFLRDLASTADYLIFSSPNPSERVKVVREAIRHLQRGGMVLIFPSGGIDPDPEVMPQALDALETWSPSLEVLLRRVPSTRILVTMVSGVLHAGWIHHPIIHLRRGRRNQQRVAEFFQVMQQTLFPNSLSISPLVSFAEPILMPSDTNLQSLAAIIASAKEHFKTVVTQIRR